MSLLKPSKEPPEWGKDLDWGYLPIHREYARVSVTCNYGLTHEIEVPVCRSVIEESKTYGKRRLIQCEKPAGHEGPHRCMTDLCYWKRWEDK